MFSVPRNGERGLAIITPLVVLIQRSQGDRAVIERNRKCETQRGIKRETKAHEEGKDWKRGLRQYRRGSEQSGKRNGGGKGERESMRG